MILAPAIMTAEPDPKKAGAKCLESIQLDPDFYRIGHTRVNAKYEPSIVKVHPCHKVQESKVHTFRTQQHQVPSTINSQSPVNCYAQYLQPYLQPPFSWTGSSLLRPCSTPILIDQTTFPPRRYKILNPKAVCDVADEKKCAELILDASGLDADLFRLGKTKARYKFKLFENSFL